MKMVGQLLICFLGACVAPAGSGRNAHAIAVPSNHDAPSSTSILSLTDAFDALFFVELTTRARPAQPCIAVWAAGFNDTGFMLASKLDDVRRMTQSRQLAFFGDYPWNSHHSEIGPNGPSLARSIQPTG